MSHFAPCPALDPLLVIFALNDPSYIHTRCMYVVGIDLSRFYQVLDLDDRDLGSRCHHGIEVLRRLPIDEVAPLVALPGLDQGEIGLQRVFQHIGSPFELARFLAFGDYRSVAGRSKERMNARATSPNALGKRALRDQLEVDLACYDHLFQQLVLTHITSLVRANLPGVEHEAETELVHTDVIADGVEVLHAFVYQSTDKVLGNPAQPEATDHEGRAVLDVGDGLVCTRKHFVHRHSYFPNGRLYRGRRCVAKFACEICNRRRIHMPVYAVINQRGSAYQKSLPLEGQVEWDAHASFMDALVEDGFVVLGGPLEGSDEVLLIVRASSPE